jgi:hypothetical protein
MAFEVFTGSKPYVGATTATLLYNIAHSPPAFPEAMPAAERAVFARALAKKPDERYADLASFLRALIGATVTDPSSRDRLLAVLAPTDAGEPDTPGSALTASPSAAASSSVAIADGMKPSTVIVLGAGAIAALVAAGYAAWVLGRSAPAPSTPSTMAQERPAANVSPTTPEVAFAMTSAAAPTIARPPPAASQAAVETAEPSVMSEATASNATPATTSSENSAVPASPAEPVTQRRRQTSDELRNAVRDALRDQGMSSVEVHVEPDGRVRLANLRDEAEAARARTVAGSVSEQPLIIQTSVRTPKRQDHRSSRPSVTEHGDTAPAWEIHRGGAEQTD